MSTPNSKAAESSIPWWGLTRRQPRFWLPKPVRWREAAYSGAILSLILIHIAWLLDFFYHDDLAAILAKMPWRVQAAVKYLPLLPIAAALLMHALGWFNERDATRMQQRPITRWLERWIFLVRERGHLSRLDGFLLVFSLSLFVCLWLELLLPPHFRQSGLLASASVVLSLSLGLLRNRFHPIARRFQTPAWFRELCRTAHFGEPPKIAGHTVPAPDSAWEVAWPDESSHFLYKLSDDLPAPIQHIGVRVSEEVKRLMDRLLAQSGGALFRKDDMRGSAEMLNPFEGPLDTIGLVELKRLIGQIASRAKIAEWKGMQLPRVLLAFVQREIRYADDEETTGYTEYGRFPLQTLIEGQGDCECKVLLCCALLSYSGYESALIFHEGHVRCGLLVNHSWWHFLHRLSPTRTAAHYRWGETTADDGGDFAEPTTEQLGKVTRVIKIPAMDLNSEGQ